MPAVRRLRRRFPARRDRLSEVCQLVEQAADASGFDERTNHACQLAVCEAVENIILHGYGGDSADEIEISLQALPGSLDVEIIDQAPPFNPVDHPVQADVSVHDPQVGGRGLVMLRRIMDDIRYERRGSRNVLRLTKSQTFRGA